MNKAQKTRPASLQLLVTGLLDKDGVKNYAADLYAAQPDANAAMALARRLELLAEEVKKMALSSGSLTKPGLSELGIAQTDARKYDYSGCEAVTLAEQEIKNAAKDWTEFKTLAENTAKLLAGQREQRPSFEAKRPPVKLTTPDGEEIEIQPAIITYNLRFELK